MKYLYKIIPFYVYSNLHVALASTGLALFVYLSNNIVPDTNYLLFVFTSTLSLYAIHKLIGSKKVEGFGYHERIQFSASNTYFFIIEFVLSSIGVLYFASQLPLDIIYNLILPILLSGLYVFPIFKGKRLRDFAFVKIFLITISWAIICAYIPLMESSLSIYYTIIWIALITFYVFAITLPFDIRDFEIDKYMYTVTIPTKFGILKTIGFAKMGLGFSMFFMLYLTMNHQVDIKSFIAFFLTYLIGFIMINKTRPNSPDLYISGWIEGLLMLPAILLFLLKTIF